MEWSSLAVFVVLSLALPVLAYVFNFKSRKPAQHAAVAKALGMPDVTNKKLIGFFHPYW